MGSDNANFEFSLLFLYPWRVSRCAILQTTLDDRACFEGDTLENLILDSVAPVTETHQRDLIDFDQSELLQAA